MPGPSLSQVLLTDHHWRQRLTAYVPEATFGVEWAAGKGSLTELLVDRWDYLLSLELDEDFCGELRRTFGADRVGVVRADILSYPLPASGAPYPLVGNLPYHLTGPLLVQLARESNRLSCFFGLVQREVAERITAESGSSDFRSISLLMQWRFRVELVEVVPATAFTPQPEVDSGWIKLTPRTRNRPFEPFREFTELCFKQPRKTLVNNLTESGDDKARWVTWFEDQGWDPRRRPHSLEVDEFLEVFDTWHEQSS